MSLTHGAMCQACGGARMSCEMTFVPFDFNHLKGVMEGLYGLFP